LFDSGVLLHDLLAEALSQPDTFDRWIRGGDR